MPEANDISAHTMACMEVWGGNRAIDTGVIMPGLDAWLYSRPYQRGGQTDSGGDIHYITSCASGRIARLIVADVSGHGAPVAKAADALRRLMRRHSNHIEQTRLLEAINREFEQIHGEQGESDGPGQSTGSLLFATAVVATYFAPTDELAVACAGHPRPIHVRRERAGASGTLIDPPHVGQGPTDLPLGVLDSTQYNVASVVLSPGDIVVFYTDSLIEAQNPAGLTLGQAGLASLLTQIDPCPPQQFAHELLRAVSTWAEKAPDDPLAFDDDLTILVIGRNALKPKPSLTLGAISTWRIVSAALRSILPGALPATFPDFNLRSLGGAMFRALNGSRQASRR
ncbi:MAG: serine/threonine-protein phosphatase [Phycisphaerales bacterium]|nr:serine/threonine-protein phosphatase [Phycisphaerales bacterium]